MIKIHCVSFLSGEGNGNCKEIQPVHPHRNQSWIFIVRTDAETETAFLWPPDVKNWLMWKSRKKKKKQPDAWKDWRREDKGMTENEMLGWHHWLDGHEFEQPLGVGGRQGRLAFYSPWGCKQLDTTERLSWTELKAMKGEIDSDSIIVGGFNVLLTSMDRPFRQKTVKETQVLHDTLDQIELMGHSIQKQQNTCIQNIL